MNTDDMTVKQARELVNLFGRSERVLDSGLIGKFVIVRCKDAGIHAGTLEYHFNRECVLTNSRRLWYWKPNENRSFLSGVAIAGLHPMSKVGAVLPRLLLTENCEIIECTPAANKSIMDAPEHVQ